MAPIANLYDLNLEITQPDVDPTFRVMHVDKDGKIRKDCIGPYAMADFIKMKDNYQIVFGNNPDVDRHGIVTPPAGLLNPNHYLAVVIDYLFTHRPGWPATAIVGKTLVSSDIIDRVANALGRKLAEVPVGFRWFVEGLLTGYYDFGGEESFGVAFLRRNGSVRTTDKDGIILNLLAAEITAVPSEDPVRHYQRLTHNFADPVYRLDAPTSREQKSRLAAPAPANATAETQVGEQIMAKLTVEPGKNALIGGLKVTTVNSWSAPRPSGTGEIYKIYAGSYKNRDHLRHIKSDAQSIIDAGLAKIIVLKTLRKHTLRVNAIFGKAKEFIVRGTLSVMCLPSLVAAQDIKGLFQSSLKLSQPTLAVVLFCLSILLGKSLWETIESPEKVKAAFKIWAAFLHLSEKWRFVFVTLYVLTGMWKFVGRKTVTALLITTMILR